MSDLPSEAITLDDFEYSDLTHPMSVASPEEKLQVALHWYIYRSPTKAANQMANTKITPSIVKSWRSKAKWWPMLIDKCKKIKDEELESMLTATLNDSVAELRDRLENGNVVGYDEDGNEKRLPVPARDLTYVAQIMFDKRALARGEGAINKSATDNQLQKVADMLIKTIQDTKKEGVTITQHTDESDITDVD